MYEKGFRGKEGTGLDFLEPFTVENGLVTTPLVVEGRFVWTQGTLDSELAKGSTIELSKKFGLNVGRHDQAEKTKTPSTLLLPGAGIGTNEDASQELAEIFGREMGKVFPYPKPSSFVQYLIRAATYREKDAIVLDSFAGSGTTAHAVLKLNADDDCNRRFILVELDEDIASTVTAPRVSRVVRGYTAGKGEKIEGLGGDFQFCRLSQEPLFTPDGQIREDVRFEQLAEFVWFSETGTGFRPRGKSPLLGIHQGRAIYLLYNGILADRSVDGGNVLTSQVLDVLEPHDGPRVVYAAACRLGAPRLQRERIVFRQTPYALDVSP